MVDRKEPEKPPRAQERFFSHLHEMERAFEREVIEWSERDAIEAQKRLDHLVARIGDVVRRFGRFCSVPCHPTSQRLRHPSVCVVRLVGDLTFTQAILTGCRTGRAGMW